MNVSPKQAWENALAIIQKNVSGQQFTTWFQSMIYEAFDNTSQTLSVQVPSLFVYEYLEENYIDLLSKVLRRSFGADVKLRYRVVTDKEHHLTQDIAAEQHEVVAPVRQNKTRANQSPTPLDAALPQDLDPNLNVHQTFSNYIEGKSNKLSRSVGLSIAEHPGAAQFNPLFIYGPSGCGKTHLINAIGMRAKQLYPQKRVLYVSARLFQLQYSDSILRNTSNDFINFYQTIDMLIVDDVQEWMTLVKTQDTFFHIFNHLFRNGKHIILASDRPPVDLQGMSERLLTRFACGIIAELEKPNEQLCIDILHSKIEKEGLQIPDDVVQFIAATANGSVRDLQGVINSLLAYSVVYNTPVDMKLAQRIIQRAVKIDDKPLTIDDILESVSKHFNISLAAINGRSRKQDFVMARQLSMYLAQKYTKMPASRIGKLVGGRDHSTVLHSCQRIEERIQVDSSFSDEVMSIENSFKLKK